MKNEVMAMVKKIEWLVTGYDTCHEFGSKATAMIFFKSRKSAVPKEETLIVYEIEFDEVDGKRVNEKEKIVAEHTGK